MAADLWSQTFCSSVRTLTRMFSERWPALLTHELHPESLRLRAGGLKSNDSETSAHTHDSWWWWTVCERTLTSCISQKMFLSSVVQKPGRFNRDAYRFNNVTVVIKGFNNQKEVLQTFYSVFVFSVFGADFCARICCCDKFSCTDKILSLNKFFWLFLDL